jgi:glycosyltransferase involved in cell wall biosynthesis
LNKISKRDKLNIAVLAGHTPYELLLAETGHNFYSIPGPNVLPWNDLHGVKPQNYTVCDPSVFNWIDFDLMITHNPLGHAHIWTKYLHKMPVVCLFHTCCPQNFDRSMWDQFPLNMTSNVFITEYAKISWGNKEGRIVGHAVDTDFFKPLEKRRQVLTVCNDFLGRSYEYGFDVYRYIRSKLENEIDFVLVGDSPGLSKPASSRQDIARIYGESLIYLSTHVVSPIPFSLLEAASAGCIPVTSACCSAPDYFTNRRDSLIYGISHPDDAVDHIKHVLEHKDDFTKYYGENARQRMISLDKKRFIREWNEVFYGAV